jgi:cell filamentation protein
LSGDPYLIPGTTTLANRAGITDADQLARFETRMSIVRLAQLEAGEVAVAGRWDLAHLQAFHRHIFQDVYHWAGQLRTVDISKGVATRRRWAATLAGEPSSWIGVSIWQ